MLSPADTADVEAIIAVGTQKPFADVDRAHKVYMRLCHERGWDGRKAREIYDAWWPVVDNATMDDIPF